MWLVQSASDTGCEEDSPEAVAGVCVVVAAASRRERRIIAAENELQPGSEEINSHKHSLPARLLCHLKGEKVVRLPPPVTILRSP